MVEQDTRMMSQVEVEVESQLQADQHQHKDSGLGRTLSIYSLTLDEFQNTLIERGKSFGSMNMDEFLNSIWTAEENQAHAQAYAQSQATRAAENTSVSHFALGQTSASSEKGIDKQPSLSRQGSFTIPEPMCRKTVEEVWSDISKTQQEQHHNNGSSSVQNHGFTQKQATFGEMTLEDFLVRAGVVREQGNAAPPPQQQAYGMYQSSTTNAAMPPTYVVPPVIGLGGVTGGIGVGVPSYQPLPQPSVVEAPLYPASMKRVAGYAQPRAAAVYGGRVGNGSGAGYGQVHGVGMPTPLSPVSSDGLCGNQVDSGRLEMEVRGPRKRIIDGPVEKVVERRQRRMIKNRESAAKSRARKQAYTIELEAELNQLKEENAHLKQALHAELERKRKQQYLDEMKMKAQTKAQKANRKLRGMGRSLSCPC